jgi:CrcB protein
MEFAFNCPIKLPGLITPVLKIRYWFTFKIKIGNHQLQNYMIVFLGVGFGGAFRYWGSNCVYKFLPSSFPHGTLFVNTLGSLIIGIVMFYFAANELISPKTHIFLATGFRGGLTTFSTFSFETINFMKEKEYLFAGANILLNVLLTLLALFTAYKISKLLNGG